MSNLEPRDETKSPDKAETETDLASEICRKLSEIYPELDAILLYGTDEEKARVESAVKRLSDTVGLRQRQAAFEHGID